MKRKGKYVQLELPFEHLDDEIWKDIKGYEGLYQASNLGRVKSLGNNKNRKEKILKSFLNHKGYLRVGLCKNGKVKRYFVHRLVYEAFIGEIPKGMQVNHKDENPQNNILSNIDTLMTQKENNNWGTHNERIAKANINNPKRCKSVIQKSLDGKVIRIWASGAEVEKELGYSKGNISWCCRGKFKQRYGYIWEYYTEEAV